MKPEIGQSDRLRTRGITEETSPSRESCFRWVLAGIPGENYQREGLIATPRRAAEALDEFTTGYTADLDALFTTFDSDGYDGIVTVRNIPVYSLCEHHLLPFVGCAHIAYVPDKHILGLSKMARIVNVFARRLQVQERLTGEIADAIEKYLAPAGLSVAVEAEHLCMTVRGVHAQGTMTRTHVHRGSIRDNHVELCDLAREAENIR